MIESVTAIIVALIGAGHLWERRRNRRVENKQDVVIGKITTNSGLEPHEYLEMVATVNRKVDKLMSHQLASTEATIDSIGAVDRKVDRVNQRLTRHETAGHGGQTGL